MRFIPLILCLLTIFPVSSSYARTPMSTEVYKERLEEHLGTQITNITKLLGPPDTIYTSRQNSDFVMYRWTRMQRRDEIFAARAKRRFCTTNIEVDPANRTIQRVVVTGNNCYL